MASISNNETAAPSFSKAKTPTTAVGSATGGNNKRCRPRRDEDGFSEAYLSRYGLTILLHQQDFGSSSNNYTNSSTKALECRFCRAFGREKSPRAIREVVRSAKTFTPPFKTDYFVEHLRHAHPHRWGEYSGLATDGERTAYWETSGNDDDLDGGLLDAAQRRRRSQPPGPPFAERRQPPSSIDPATMSTPPQPLRRRQRVGRSQSNSGAAGSNAVLEPLPQVGFRAVSSSTDSDAATAARAAALSMLAIPVSPPAHPRPHTLRTFRFQRGRSRINDLLCRIRPGDTMAQIVQKAQTGDALNVFGAPTTTTATAMQGRRPRSFRASPPPPKAGVRLYTIDGVGSFSEKVFAAIPVLDVLALCPANPLVVRLEYRQIESSSSSDDDSRDGGSSAPSSSATTSSLEGSGGAAPAPDEHSLQGPRRHLQHPHHGSNSEVDDDDDDGEPIEYRGAAASAHDTHEEDHARVPSPVPLRYIHLAPALELPHPPPPPHPSPGGSPPRPYSSLHPSGGGGGGGGGGAAHWSRESPPSHRF